MKGMEREINKKKEVKNVIFVSGVQDKERKRKWDGRREGWKE